ncbi:SDR family oxidoreductase [Amycolatopsis nigrescens]|uniref:SDR family oxidoreductase n=1 Tax=Amycolatopsis nigrescens TaxID=381445 RepID=UPI00047561B2|nr:NAD(P)H-binding protein [Amycolatopsis nigrescens]
MRVLVTGATGRVGKVLVPALVKAGHQVRAMSRRSRPESGPVEWVVADLTTGDGLTAALVDVQAVVHLASAPYKGRYTGKVEVGGTERLLAAAGRAGVEHLIYTSIVGADQVPWGYFKTKVRAEEIVRAAPVPWTILRATQFHDLFDLALGGMSKLGVLIADPGVDGQTVDVRDVAERLLDQLERGPSERIEEFGGPEVLPMDAAARQWLRATGKRRPVLRLRLPGKLGRAFRGGHLVTEVRPAGTVTWARFLTERAERTH